MSGASTRKSSRFYDQPDLATKLLAQAISSSHGKLNVELKQQAADLSFLQKLVRGKLPGQASDWNRVVEESHVAHLFRGSVVIPAGHAAVEKLMHDWFINGANPREIKAMEDIRTQLRAGYEFQGLLVENHYFGIVWAPEYSFGEKMVLMGVEFVKLAAAIATAVVTVGAAAPVVAIAASQAAGSVQQLLAAGKAVGKAATSAHAVVDAGLNVQREKERLDGGVPATSLELHRQRVELSTGSYFDGDLRKASGVDLGMLDWNHVDKNMKLSERPGISQEQAKQDAAILKKMFFMVVQRVLPIRSKMEKGSLNGFDNFDRHFLTRSGYKYKADLEYFREVKLRIGPTSREIVAAASSAYKDLTYMNLLNPFSLLGVVDGGAYDEKRFKIDEMKNWNHPSPYSALPAYKEYWDSLNEPFDVEVPMPQDVVNRVNSSLYNFGLIVNQRAAARNERVKANVKEFIKNAKNAVAAKKILIDMNAKNAVAAKRILIDEAKKRRLMATDSFESFTLVKGPHFWNNDSRDPRLQSVLGRLGRLERVGESEYKMRIALLRVINEDLVLYFDNVKSNPTAASRAARDLKTQVEEEIKAIENCPDYVAHVDDSFDIL
jgi:hypothetical protein